MIEKYNFQKHKSKAHRLFTLGNKFLMEKLSCLTLFHVL